MVPRRRPGPVHDQPLLGRLLPRRRSSLPKASPTCPRDIEFAWTKGAVKKEIDLTLPRGVLIRGKVTEEGTGRPVAGASVQFFADDAARETSSPARSRSWPAGRRLVPDRRPARQGPPDRSRARRSTTSSRRSAAELLRDGQPGGQRNYAHDIIAYDVKAGERAHAVIADAAAGQDARGRVVGPDGQAGRRTR